MTLLAKSGGAAPETLLDHTWHVVTMAAELCHRLPASLAQDRDIAEVTQQTLLAAAAHDLGKAASGFQRMLRGEQPDWHKRRHETLSAAFLGAVSQASEESVLAVLTHHKQIPGRISTDSRISAYLALTGGVPPQWSQMKSEWHENAHEAVSIWNEVCRRLGKLGWTLLGVPELAGLGLDEDWFDTEQARFPFERRMLASLLRGLLVSADHLASAHECLPPMISFGAWTPRYQPRPFQLAAGDTDGHAILRAPTGSGKTEAALLWVARNSTINSRLFYVLPYVAAINAMHRRLRQEFPDTPDSIGVMHSRAAHHLYALMSSDSQVAANSPAAICSQAATNSQGIVMAKASLAREMYHPVRVCTPHQILRYTLRGRGWENMLAEMHGATFVFDEIHAYDARLCGLIIGSAELLTKVFRAKILFLSATLPSFLESRIRQAVPCTVIQPQPQLPSDAEVCNRRRHQLGFLAGNMEEQIPVVAKLAAGGQSVLVVCNHVASAQNVWLKLRETVRGALSEHDVILLHSRFNRRDRRARELAISGAQLPRILVATQAVEVSLDLSFDVGFSEPAPIDALAQRFGRVNRLGTTPKPFFLVERQISSHELYPKDIVQSTMQLLRKAEPALSESDLVAMVNDVYQGGFSPEQEREFGEARGHLFFQDIERTLLAGCHEDWVDEAFGNTSGNVEAVPECLLSEYRQLRSNRRWLDADALMVDLEYRRSSRDLRYSVDDECHVVKTGYSVELGLSNRS